MVGLYDHQLLIWPRLIHKLRMKTRARCCCWGHYRDPTTHFSTSLSQLLQRNPIDGFQFSFQWCFSWTSQPVCQPVARVAPKKIWKGCMEKVFRKLAAAILTRRFTQYSPEANQTVRFLFAPTVTSSPHWTLDGDVFQSRVL